MVTWFHGLENKRDSELKDCCTCASRITAQNAYSPDRKYPRAAIRLVTYISMACNKAHVVASGHFW